MSLAADLGQLWSDSAKMLDLEVWYPSVLAAASPDESDP
jgi:hypothetical protein